MTKPKKPITGADRKRWGRKGGKTGGRKRALSLSPERRSEIARKACETRWAKQRQREAEAAAAVPRETDPAV